MQFIFSVVVMWSVVFLFVVVVVVVFLFVGVVENSLRRTHYALGRRCSPRNLCGWEKADVPVAEI